MMLPVAFERLIASEGIGIVDRALVGLGQDMTHQFLSAHRLHQLGIDPPLPPQKTEYQAFPGNSTPLPLALVSIIEEVGPASSISPLSLARGFGDVIENFPQALVDARERLDVYR